jgi:mannose-6-phosphate isomerase-like protein (cupin superfamily)
MIQPVDLSEKFNLFGDHWHSKIVGELNDSYVKLAKLKGDFVWHRHDAEDELFFVVKGVPTIRLRDRDLRVREGQFVIIPQGTEHQPVAAQEVHVVLLEPKTTVSTGNVESDRTVAPEWI